MTFPAGITTCTVTGTIVQAVADGGDAGTAPDKVPATGQVTFTPDVVDKLRSNQTSPKMLILPDPVPVALDANGSFTVELIATDCPDLNPLDWTYTVSFSLGDGQKIAPFSMAAPGGTTVDLADVAPIADSAGMPFLPGPAGPANTLSIGTVSTLAAGSNATASVTGTSPNQTLNLGIPKGADGSNGTNGTNASLSIGTVSTLAAGSNATASITGSAPTQTLNLGIPAGASGTGSVSSVTAADSTITVGGTTANPTVKANVGTASGTVAAGNDSRITGAVQSVTAADSTVTVGGTATAPTVKANTGTASGTVAAGNDSRFAGSAAGTSGAALSATDPVAVGWGLPYTIHPSVASGAPTWGLSVTSGTLYMRVMQGGVIDRIRFRISGMTSGSVTCKVGVYSNTGTGKAAQPGSLVASGSVTTSSAGDFAPTLGSTVTVNPGDWFAFTCSSVNPNFAGTGSSINTSPGSSNLGLGICYAQSTGTAMPATPGSLTPLVAQGICLVGSNGA